MGHDPEGGGYMPSLLAGLVRQDRLGFLLETLEVALVKDGTSAVNS